MKTIKLTGNEETLVRQALIEYKHILLQSNLPVSKRIPLDPTSLRAKYIREIMWLIERVS